MIEIDRFIEEETAFQAEAGHNDADKKASVERVNAAQKSKSELDGVAQQADATSKEMEKSIDTILFGRVTYEMMAQYRPISKDPEAPMMNETPKVVFSRTLKKLDWQNSRLAGPYGDIVVVR